MTNETVNLIEPAWIKGRWVKKRNPEVCMAGTTGYYDAKIILFFNMQQIF